MRAGLEQAVPFNRHLGLEIAELGFGRGVVRLPDDDRLRNPLGSQHAGALFAAGHAASGTAFVAVFLEQLQDLTPVAEGAQIAYRTIARGPITATAVLGGTAEELLADLERDGSVRFSVDVSLTDGAGTTVAEMTVRWLLPGES